MFFCRTRKEVLEDSIEKLAKQNQLKIGTVVKAKQPWEILRIQPYSPASKAGPTKKEVIDFANKIRDEVPKIL